MRNGLQALGYDTGVSETPIVPVLIGQDDKTFMFWRALFDHGVFSNPVVPPAVPEKESRIRTSYSATHTREQLDFVLDVFTKVGRQFGVI
jgi:7-keto-8-aminopelargonate synthetase-like enzyme